MTRDQVREMVEDVTNIVVARVVDPIDSRLVRIETMLEVKKQRNQFLWKVVTLSIALPGALAAMLGVLKLAQIL